MVTKAPSFFDKLLDMWRESTLIQGTLTIGLVTVWVIMIFTARPIPDVFNSIVTLVVGFYFGAKSVQSARAIVQDYVNK